jgi:uncharacterized membrane protein YbjE (DUF340 family)
MVIGILLLIVGVFLGLLLNKKKRIVKLTGKLTDVSIFLLLFFLGVSVGMNEKIVSNFRNIGLQALWITLAATVGSVLVSYVVYLLFFKKNRR